MNKKTGTENVVTAAMNCLRAATKRAVKYCIQS